MKDSTKENQTIVINENSIKSENSAKIIKSENVQDEIISVELPAVHQNNLTENTNIKDGKTESPSQLKTSGAQRKREMEVLEEPVQNSELTRIKNEQLDTKRRRSLRNETASTTKKKPAKYEEILNCYRKKEYKECIIYIDLVAANPVLIEYQILKAACFIHLGIKLGEAHKILDDILKIHHSNPFTYYAKGLAYYNEEKWKDSIKYFEKAINLDKGSMGRAEVMLKLAKEELEKVEKPIESDLVDTIKTEPMDEDEQDDEMNSFIDDDKSENYIETKVPSANRNADRFRCEICDKPFCKKFNLDRHNRIMHNRETPYIPPLPRNYNNRRSAPVEPIKIEENSDDDDDEEEEEKLSSLENSLSTPRKSSKFKIRLGNKVKRTQSLPSSATKKEMGRCRICNKLYRKGSLARHEVTHTGNKQFKCEECPMAFYQKSDLQRHVTIHSNVFDFECELCDKKFRIKKNLQVHNKRHHSK